jgi:hypothetical protein
MHYLIVSYVFEARWMATYVWDWPIQGYSRWIARMHLGVATM